ncbi:MAG: Hpt domain-containing protein [Bacteroidales bacterium]|jgi:HPt (histidine-containing phosphotransfer) domain-containing protein
MIDWDIFNDRLGCFDEDLILELINMFISDYPQRMISLKKSVEDKDFHELDENAHTLKTNCATFGDNDSARLAYNLELMGKNQVAYNALLVNSDSWVQLELLGNNNPGDDMKSLFIQFVSSSEGLVQELEQYRKKHS